jgi:uncharacterized RDD family membrane protein YckC
MTLSPSVRARQGSRAGVVSRTIAAGIDFVVIVLAQAALFGAIVGVLFLLSPRHFSWPSGLEWSFPAVGFFIAVPYLTFCWCSTGRSYGDALLGLRVISRDGRHLSVAVALLRAVICVLFPIGLFWSAISAANRSIQDVIVRSSVIHDWSSHAAAPARREPASAPLGS